MFEKKNQLPGVTKTLWSYLVDQKIWMQLRTYPISVSVFNLDYCPAVVWEFRGDAFLIWVLIKRAPWIQTVVYAALDM